jgi:hypothetical protein
VDALPGDFDGSLADGLGVDLDDDLDGDRHDEDPFDG